MPDATITSTASTFGTISGTFAADQSTVTGTVTGIITGTLTGSVGVPGPAGPAGAGVPAGGTAGQYLQKIDGVDYNTDWVTLNLSAYAPINSPVFTGDPQAPTPTFGDNDTSIATTAFVQAGLLGGTANAKNLEVYVRNQSGSTIPAGAIVYISGATGNRPLITLAQANNDANSAQTMGFTKTSIANNGFGYVIVRGELENIDTSALTEGVQLYLSPTTAGTWTTTKPSAPQHLVYVGIVVRAHPTQGVILVAVQNGYELDELHTVSLTSPANNDLLTYESSSSLWKNKSFSTLDLATQSWVTAGFYPLTGNPSGFLTSASLTAYLTKADNLGSLTDFYAARSNLGLGELNNPTFAGVNVSGSGTNDANLGPTFLTLNQQGVGQFTIQPSQGIVFPDATIQTTAYPGPAGATAWGTITGTLSSQTDLQTALDGKYSTSNPAGYITSSALTGYATESWVTAGFYPLTGNPSGFITSSALTPYAPLAGATFTGKVNFKAGTTSSASVNLAPGVAPTSPTTGDLWYDSSISKVVFRSSALSQAIASEFWVTAQSYIDASALSAALGPYLTSADAATTYYPLSNPAGYIDASSLAGYATESWVTAGFYPLTGNPSGFIDASYLTSYAALSGADFTGRVTIASVAGGAPNFNIGNVSGVTGMVDGDIWKDISGLHYYDGTDRLLATQDYVTAQGYLAAANNLSELTGTASTARTNLGLGTAAVEPATKLVPAGGTTGQVLTKLSNADWDDAWATPSGGGGANFQEFTTAGTFTWTKPANAKFVHVRMYGGGGGGGSGMNNPTTLGRAGGAGGSPGCLVELFVDAASLGATETVVVGAGGNGGASQTTANTTGNPGTVGGASSFSYWRAGGGGNGAGGNASNTLTPTTSVHSVLGYTNAAAGIGAVGINNTGNTPANISSAFFVYGTGGGGGAGAAATVVTNVNGGAGQPRLASTGNSSIGIITQISGGSAGTSTGTPPTAGVNGGFRWGGSGGGGGAYRTGVAGMAGAAGGFPAGGGGGGSAADNLGSGAGGAGARGAVYITTYS